MSTMYSGRSVVYSITTDQHLKQEAATLLMLLLDTGEADPLLELPGTNLMWDGSKWSPTRKIS